MHKVLALVSGAICLFSASIAVAAPSEQKPQSFTQWCLRRESAPADTKHTIDVLPREADTNNCQQADAKLRNLTTLALQKESIVDIKPIAGLSNLRVLQLSDNEIVDIKSLARLRKSPIAHLGVGCKSREEVDDLCERAKQAGILLQAQQDSGYPIGYWAFLRDPDGHTLELSYGQEIGLTVEQTG